jgi:hypothetical protein
VAFAVVLALASILGLAFVFVIGLVFNEAFALVLCYGGDIVILLACGDDFVFTFLSDLLLKKNSPWVFLTIIP